ncbi:MAG: acetylxylan esterase [Verrucomicrobia bacterium]|nr:acetylxylan esterase [Verrucomicrobiota bacterium]
MKKLLLALLLIGTLCAALTPAFAAEKKKETAKPRDVLSASAERLDALYKRGETVTFLIELRHDEQLVGSGEVEWTLTKDGVAPTRSGRAALEGGQARVNGTLDEPGFLQCRVTAQVGDAKLVALGGAGISPLEIRPSAPAPDDFDAFWAVKKKELAAVPVNARLTSVKSPRENVEAFDVQADSVGAPVSAYLARPVGARPRSLPAILTVHGAGVNSSSLSGAAGWAAAGALAMDLNAHGLPNGRDKAFYEALAAGELKDYRARGRESRETIYFLGMMLRLVRAIDFLTAQPEWDGRTVVASGSSQGGFQALAAAGLDPRVTFFAAGVPAGCDHTGALAGRIAGWPKFIPTKEAPPPAEVVAAVRYFDCVNFAARAKAPGFFTVGFIDTTCPPTSVYAAYNALKAPKEIHHDVAAGHTNTPAASAAMRAAVLKHFASQR